MAPSRCRLPGHTKAQLRSSLPAKPALRQHHTTATVTSGQQPAPRSRIPGRNPLDWPMLGQSPGFLPTPQWRPSDQASQYPTQLPTAATPSDPSSCSHALAALGQITAPGETGSRKGTIKVKQDNSAKRTTLG